jgi:hypothetical protein
LILNDVAQALNTGVLSDERAGSYNSVVLRRIRYCDLEIGKTYAFITNEFALPPGLLTFIYKLCWDVEKHSTR